jgi:prepilin peptidase CpaA
MADLQAILELLGMLLAQPRTVLLLTLLLVAALIDWRSFRIPNWLTMSGSAAAVLMAVLDPTPQLGWSSALAGLALGLAMLLPLYFIGVMGAGDVKLMAMVGAFLGLPHTLQAVLFVVVTGGVAALLTVMLRRAWSPLRANLKSIFFMARVAPEAVTHPRGVLASMPSVGQLPYGVSICAGTWIYVISHQLGYV